jgi:hypothetical protein
MFLIFINDITHEIVGLGRPFADDTSIGHIAQDESTLRNMINTSPLIPYLPSLYKSAFTQTVSNALLISANVTLVTCFASNASNIRTGKSLM